MEEDNSLDFDEEILTLDTLNEYECDDQDQDISYDLAPTPAGITNFNKNDPLFESSSNNSKRWQDPETRFLIEQYRLCLPQIGPMKKFKNKEAIWGYIQVELLVKDHSFTVKQVKNKFTQLLRSYKGAIDNNKKTGRKKKTCPFFKELHEIFGERSSVNPPFVLTASEMTEASGSALVDNNEFNIQSSPSPTISSSSGNTRNSSPASSTTILSPLASATISSANSQSSTENINSSPVNDSSHPINVKTAPVTVADFKKSRDSRKKKTLADEIRTLKEVKKEYYDGKLQAYKDYNEKRLKLMADLLKRPTSSDNNVEKEAEK